MESERGKKHKQNDRRGGGGGVFPRGKRGGGDCVRQPRIDECTEHLGHEIDAKEREYSAVQRRVEVRKREFEAKSKQLESIQRRITECEGKLRLKEEECNWHLETFHRLITEREEVYQKMQMAIQNCNRDLVEKEERLCLIDNLIGERQQELRTKDLEVHQLLNTIHTERDIIEYQARALTNKVAERNEELRTKEEELDKLQRLINRQGNEAELKKVKLMRTRINDLVQELHSLKCLIEGKSLEFEKKEKDFESMKNMFEERVRELESKDKHLESKLKQYEVQYGDHEKELKLKEKQFEVQAKKLEAKENQIEGQLKELELKEAQLKVQQKELEAKKKHCEGQMKDVESKMKQFDGKTKELEFKEARFEVQQKELESKKKFFEGQVKELESKEKQVEEKVKDLGSKEKQFKAKVMELGSREKQCEGRVEELESNEKHYERRVKVLERKEARFEGQVREFKSKKMQIEERVKDLESREKQFEGQVKELESKQKNYEGQVKELQSKHMHFEGLVHAHESKEKQFKATVRELGSREEQYEERVKGLESNEKQYEERVKGLESNEKQYEIRVKELESNEKQYEKRVLELKSKEKQFEIQGKGLKSKEKQIKGQMMDLESIKNLCEGQVKELELKEAHFKVQLKEVKSREKQVEGQLKKLDLKEVQLKEQLEKLVSMEKQFERKVKDPESKQNQCKSLTKSADEEKMLKEKSNILPHQGKTEQQYLTDANSANNNANFTDRNSANNSKNLPLLFNLLERYELMCSEVSDALQTSADPTKLVLDTIKVFYTHHSRQKLIEHDANISRRTCNLLMEELKKSLPVIDAHVKQEAMKLASDWKVNIAAADKDYLEVLDFFKFVATYEIGSSFNVIELQMLLDIISQHCETPPAHDYIEKSPDNQSSPTIDGRKLQLSYIEHTAESEEISDEDDILVNLQTSLDPAKLVLDIIKNPIIPQKKENEGVIIDGSHIFLLEQMMKISPHVKPHVREEALKLALDLKVNIRESAENSSMILGFLLLLSNYGLVSDFNEDEVLKLLEFAAQHKQAVELFRTLGFVDKISDFVQNLIKKQQHIEAVRFICAFKLANKIQPVDLLRQHMAKAESMTKSFGKKKVKVRDEEIASLGTVLQCISDNNLESQDLVNEIQDRILDLERQKENTVGSAQEPSSEVEEKECGIVTKNQVRVQQTEKKKADDGSVTTNIAKLQQAGEEVTVNQVQLQKAEESIKKKTGFNKNKVEVQHREGKKRGIGIGVLPNNHPWGNITKRPRRAVTHPRPFVFAPHQHHHVFMPMPPQYPSCFALPNPMGGNSGPNYFGNPGRRPYRPFR